MAVEMKRVQGLLMNVEDRSPWHRLWIQVPGSQYPVKIDTQDAYLVRESYDARGGNIDATYTEQDGRNINPHTGRPYRNRYLQSLQRMNGGAPQSNPAVFQTPNAPNVPQLPPVSPEYGRQTNPVDAMRMSRAAAAKIAVLHLPYLPEEERTFARLMSIAEGWRQYMEDGPPQSQQQVPNEPRPFAGDPGHPSDWQPPADDDIPF